MKAINETIANAIVSKIEGNNGVFSVEVELNNTVLFIDGSFDIDGYCENGYNNGTGAWVVTGVAVNIESIDAYDEEGETVDFDCDLSEVERCVKTRLAA